MGVDNPNGVVAALHYLRLGPTLPCHNPVGVGDSNSLFFQGSSLLATLGFGSQTLWV